MHWNFAKLQVNALALRGLSPRQAHLISEQRRDFANLAIAHALGTLSFILEDPSIGNSIQAVPLYLHTMITYASVFLLRVHARWRPARLNASMTLAISLIERTAQLLSQARVGERHLCIHVASGLVKMLVKFKKLESAEVNNQPRVDLNHYAAMEAAGQDDWAAVESGSDTMFGDIGMYNNMDQEFLPPVFFDLVSQQMPG